MPFIVCRKPSGVHFVAMVSSKDEVILYDVAIRKLYSLASEAELEVRRLEKERRKQHKKLMASQLELIREEQPRGSEYI